MSWTSSTISGGDVPMAIETDSRHLPAVLRTPSELATALQKLESRVKSKKISSEQPQQQQPQHIVDLDRLDRDLQPLENYRVQQQAMVVSSFGQQQEKQEQQDYDFHERIVADVITQSLDSLRVEGDAAWAKELERDWDATRSRILQEMNLMENKQVKATAATTQRQDEKPEAANPFDSRLSSVRRGEETPKMLEFFRVLKDNRAALSSSPKDIIRNFIQASNSVGSDADAAELWSLVYELVETTNKLRKEPEKMRTKRAVRAKSFLERQYREKRYGQSELDEKLVRAVHAKEKNNSEAILYHLCRSGYWDAAEKKLAAKDPLREFVIRLQNCQYYPFVYQASSNPYRDVLGRLNDFKCEIPPEISPSVEDFLWVRLCAALTGSDDEDKVAARMRELTEMVKEKGPGYFEAGANPFFYARILATCGEIEGALDFLAQFFPTKNVAMMPSTKKDPLPDAVHLAIVLRFAGEHLLLSSSSTSSTTSTGFVDDSGKLRYSHLLEFYSSRFLDPVAAMHYCTCFPSPVKDRGDLLPATKLLARPAPEGGPAPLWKVLKQNVEDVAAQVALDAAKESRPMDACNLLYDLLMSKGDDHKSEAMEVAIPLITKELARVMASSAPQDAKERKFWRDQTDKFTRLLSSSQPQYFNRTLGMLRGCVNFYDQVFMRSEEAPAVLEKLGLFPSNKDSVDAAVGMFEGLDPLLVDAFPDLVSKCVECHALAFERGKKDDAKQRLSTLVAFIAALREKRQYRLRWDVEKYLALTESRIGV